MTMLYPEQLPERGGVRMEFAESPDKGVTGVMASVLGLLTGSAHDGGFKRPPVAGSCAVTCSTSAVISAMLRVTRLDTGAAVDADADLLTRPSDPELPGLMQRCLDGSADPAERRRFAELWQASQTPAARALDDEQVFTLCHVSADDARNYDR